MCLDAGADLIMVESEGITENTTTWRTDVIARFIQELGANRVSGWMDMERYTSKTLEGLLRDQRIHARFEKGGK